MRLQKAAEANPRRLLDPFADLGGDEKDDDDQTPALTDSFADWLSDLGDDQESWDRRLDNPSPEPALNPDGGRQSNSGLDAVAARCRTRLETMDQLARQLLSTCLLYTSPSGWLRNGSTNLIARPKSALLDNTLN